MLCVWVWVFIHTLDLKAMEKGRLLVLCLARTKHFMLSMKHIFCVFTSGSDLDILDLIRVLHQSGGNVQVRFCTKCCTAKFNGANYIHRRFSGHGRHFKFFQSFRYAVFVSFWNGLEFGPRGLQDDKRVLEDVKNEKNPSSDWFNLSPLLKRFRNNAPSLAIVC